MTDDRVNHPDKIDPHDYSLFLRAEIAIERLNLNNLLEPICAKYGIPIKGFNNNLDGIDKWEENLRQQNTVKQFKDDLNQLAYTIDFPYDVSHLQNYLLLRIFTFGDEMLIYKFVWNSKKKQKDLFIYISPWTRRDDIIKNWRMVIEPLKCQLPQRKHRNKKLDLRYFGSGKYIELWLLITGSVTPHQIANNWGSVIKPLQKQLPTYKEYEREWGDFQIQRFAYHSKQKGISYKEITIQLRKFSPPKALEYNDVGKLIAKFKKKMRPKRG